MKTLVDGKYLTARDLVASAMVGRTHIFIPDIVAMVEKKYGRTLALNSVRQYVSSLAAEGWLCYVARGTVSHRVTAGVEWNPDPVTRPNTTPREKKKRPNLPVQYALLKATYLLDKPAGARTIRNFIGNCGQNLIIPPLTSVHRNLTVLEDMGVLKRTRDGWEARPAQSETLLAEWKAIVEPNAPGYFFCGNTPAPTSPTDDLDPELADLLS